MNIATIFALLLAGQGNADCDTGPGVIDIWGAPLPLEAVAVDVPVSIAPDTVIALEVAQVASRMWRTQQELHLPGLNFTYPAGIRVTAMRSHRGDERCLRDAVPAGTGPRRGEVIPCLLDEDGDGRFETVEIFNLNAIIPYAGTTPRFRPRQRVSLSEPVTMEEDPQGVGSSRIRIHRRLRVTEMGGDAITVVVEHATQSARALMSYPVGGGGPSPVPLGEISFRTSGAPRAVALIDDAVNQIGGLRFRVERAANGWTLTPLDRVFPEWLAYRCWGTQITTRVIPL